ncbi:MAG: DNA polymerase III subunit gamma/tau [Candidatus Pelagibacter sp.]
MNKEKQVLALKYRPQNFEDLIGQEVVAETISKAIKQSKVSNAYLFTGIRGVGKTTIARILAKSLNCTAGIENQCKLKCENCDAITNSNHIDVLEIDAASKTGIDDVRELIEFSRYGPTSSKYKIFIIDEVHMLSKQAFNALLKTLEEPPEYLKFIFATTEVKKIPVTVLSRCTRFDLSRVKSDELFNFIKSVSKKENGNISDDVIKLIVRISEGSVRDALSLLDRALISSDDNNKLDIKEAQKIFGYFDKTKLIELFEYLFSGNENKVIDIYRSIYNQGVDPKIFLNDFLEILYYLKNISFIDKNGNNFNLNDDDHDKIVKIAESLENSTLLLFWQFTIKTLSEIEIVSDPNISLEMFLIRLLYVRKKVDSDDLLISNEKETMIETDNKINAVTKKTSPETKTIENINTTVGQIKNVAQEKKINENLIKIDTFDNLVNTCIEKKELKLKYELENNVSLVSFEIPRIEISFNENLDKNFVKDISSKLYEWTNQRWIISFSKLQGDMPITKKKFFKRNKILEEAKDSKIYKKFLESFSDADLLSKINIDKEND